MAPAAAPLAAWLILALLMVASIVSFVDRQVVAIVVEPMKADLGVSDAQMGWLYGMFAVFYAIAALPIATAADRYSRRYIIAAGIFFWSVMTVLCGLSRTFWQVLLARIGVGVGEASLGPATVSLVGDLFPRHQVPMALSIFQTAAVMGSGVAFVIGGVVLSLVQDAQPLVLPVVGELQPWQQTFVYVGLPGILLAVVFLFLREPARKEVASTSGADWQLLRRFYRANWHTLVYHHFGFLSFALFGYAFVFWSVSYFVRTHGIEAASAAQTFGWIFLLTGPIGPVVAAWYAAWLNRRGYDHGNITAGLVFGVAAVVAIVAVQFAPTAFIAYVLYVPALICINAPFGIANGALAVIAPGTLRARVAAVYLFVVAIGNLLGPPITGFFNDVVFPQADGVRYSVIAITLLFGLLGSVLLWLGRKPYARSLQRAQV